MGPFGSPASFLIDRSGLPQNVTVDAFGRVRVSNAPTVIWVKQVWQDPLTTTTAVTATGTATWLGSNYASTELATPANNDVATFASRQHYHYQPGKGYLAYLTFVAKDFGASPDVSRAVGMSDATGGNAVRLEWDATGIYWRIRSTRPGWVTESAEQANWNIDPMNGSGPSGLTLDMSKSQIIFIAGEWLGTGDVIVGFVIGQRLVPVHLFAHSNVIDGGVYLAQPNLRLLWSQINLSGGPASDTMQAICGGLLSEGGDELVGVPRSASNGVTTKNVTTSLVPLVVLRLRSGRLQQSVSLKDIEVASASSINAEWQLIWNGTLAGSPSFNAVDADSAIEFDVAATGVSNGIVLARGYISAQQRDAELPVQLPAFGATLAGVADTYTLAARVLSGAAVATLGAMRWIERP